MKPGRILSASRVLAFGLLLPVLGSSGQAQTAPQDKDLTAYQKALLNYKSGKYEEARAAVDEAEKAKPGDAATEILKARIMTEQGDFKGGEQILRPLLTYNNPLAIQLALGDLLLRKRDFNGAAKYYDIGLQTRPGDPDIMLKMIYAHVGASDLASAEKLASKLKPLDPEHPSYYFAKAALAQATGNVSGAEEEIQTVRTIYGITVTNRYLKTYLEVLATPDQEPSAKVAPPPAKAKP